jgi:hypothetical protein
MATPPITLNVRDVALAAKRAYDEGQLSAQGFTPECQYRDPSGRPCAIGASLDDETARRFDCRTFTDVSCLARSRLIRTNDLRALKRLQTAHDNWVGGVAPEAHFISTLTAILAETEAA